MKKDLENSIIVITGSTSGIGLATFKNLAKRGAKTLLLVRNVAKAKTIISNLSEEVNPSNCFIYKVDFESIKSVKEACVKCTNEHSRIDVLINNAGAIYTKFNLTSDHIERTLAVNHIGYYLMIKGLLPSLKNAESARIINVASRAHFGVEFDTDKINEAENFFFKDQYKISKLGNILLTKKLAALLASKGITVNTLDPGLVKTPLGSKSESWWFRLVWKIFTLTGIDANKGAETSVYLTVSKKINNISGAYFENCKQVAISDYAQNEININSCWKWTQEISKTNWKT